MKVNLRMLVLATIILVISNSANATLIDNGGYVTDTTSGLDWLKLTATQDRSYNDVASKFGSGQEFEGWRYASTWELESMLLDQGIVGCDSCPGDIVLCGYDPANNGKVTPIIQLFGVLTTTIYSGGETKFNLYGWLGTNYVDHTGAVIGKTLGVMQDFEEGQPRVHDALVEVDLNHYLDNLDEHQIYLGSWLVRESMAPIPEPSIMVISPNGGESLPAGEIFEITWTSEGDIEDVIIEYSVNGGAEWIEIIASTENDGFHDWEVPCSISVESLIRISDLNSDASDASDNAFSIIDDIPPNIDVSANPDILWPPNHKMVSVTVNVDASDNCDAQPPMCQITSVSSNEPENGSGDGNTASDWEITGDLTVKLRAERSGSENGRIYTIDVDCTDASGNSSTDSVTVTVPHDKGMKKGKK